MENNAINIKKDYALSQDQRKLTSLMEQWTMFLDCKEKTRETYTRAVKQFALYLYDNGIGTPERQDIIKYRDELSKTKKATTVNAYLMAVKQFFKWTELEGFYPNITSNVKSVALTQGFKRDCLTANQIRKILTDIDTDTEKGLRDYAIISLMVTTGLRTVEVERANVEDLRTVGDFTALFIQGKGRNEKQEYVKIEDHVETAIRAYLQKREDKATGKAPLFASVAHRNQGARMTTRSISRIAKEHFIESGFNSDRLTAHSLRHTTATLNLLNGGTPEETQQLLRHKNINTTLIYSHALERAKNNSEARVANAIFNI